MRSRVARWLVAGSAIVVMAAGCVVVGGRVVVVACGAAVVLVTTVAEVQPTTRTAPAANAHADRLMTQL